MYKEQKLLVPEDFKPEILKRLHYGHLGIKKCIDKANLSFFWPGMNKQIKNMIASCHICQKYQNSQKSEPMIPHRIERVPWYKLGCDIFHFNNEAYLLTVDYYSKFFEITNLKHDMSSENVILSLKQIFSRFGIPNIVVSDNGPEFNSARFKTFSQEWEFKHITSSPRYPQSNGQVERTIQTVKKSLKKCFDDNRDIYLALLDIRNTPIDEQNSPANILMNRNLIYYRDQIVILPKNRSTD